MERDFKQLNYWKKKIHINIFLAKNTVALYVHSAEGNIWKWELIQVKVFSSCPDPQASSLTDS